MLKSFLRDSVIYAIPSFVSRGLSLFLVPLYTRVLVPDDYGALDLFMVFANVVNLTIALEVSQAVARFYSAETDENKKTGYASSAFWFTLIVYFLFALLAFLFVDKVSFLVLGRGGLEYVFSLGLIHIFLYGLVYLMQNQFRWELRSKAFAAFNLVYTLITAGLSIWLAYFENLGLVGLMWGLVGGAAITVFLGAWQLRKSFRRQFEKGLLLEMLQFSAPLVPASIAVWISSYVDRVMINHFLSLEDVGLYGIAFRLSSIVSLVMVGFQMALTPLIFTNHAKPETPREVERIFRFFVAFCLLFFASMNLLVDDLLVWFTQPAYYEAKKAVIFLVPSIILSQMYIFAPGIAIAKRTSYVIWINFIGAISNAVLNWFFIPLLGFTGAALATMLGQGLVFVIYMYYSQRLYAVPHNWYKLLSAVVGVVVLVLFFMQWEVTGLMHWISIGLTMLLTIFVFLLSGLIKTTELAGIYVLLRAKVQFRNG